MSLRGYAHGGQEPTFLSCFYTSQGPYCSFSSPYLLLLLFPLVSSFLFVFSYYLILTKVFTKMKKITPFIKKVVAFVFSPVLNQNHPPSRSRFP